MAMAAVATTRSTSTVVTHPGPARWAMSTAFQVVAVPISRRSFATEWHTVPDDLLL